MVIRRGLLIRALPFFCRWSFGVLLWEIECDGKHLLELLVPEGLKLL